MSDRLPFQGKALTPPRVTTIPRIVGEAAWQGYAACGHGDQSCERIHQRAGFGLDEIGWFIARAVDAGHVEIRIVNPHPKTMTADAPSDDAAAIRCCACARDRHSVPMLVGLTRKDTYLCSDCVDLAAWIVRDAREAKAP